MSLEQPPSLEEPMSLEQLDVDCTLSEPLPKRVVAFLEGADRHIDAFFERWRRAPHMGFFPSDHELVYGALQAVRTMVPEPPRMCEWGSGFGVIAGLGSLLGYQSCGIEIDPRLTTGSRRLLEEYRLPVEIFEGSFVPDSFDVPHDIYDPGWHTVYAENSRGEVDVDIDDFEVIFAYPWPGEEEIYYAVFEQFAAVGAIFVTYQGLNGVAVHRKTGE